MADKEKGDRNMIVSANGIRFYYEKTGTGAPIVLLHGNGQDHHIFDALTAKLKNHFTVYALDSRNHGQSDKTDDYSYETMAEDVFGVIQALSLGQVNLTGFSDGAIIGLILEMKYPAVINKMALLGVNLKPSDFTDESYLFVKETYEETKDPLFKLMLEQPQIEIDDVKEIQTPTLLVAAENDIYKPETFTDLAATLPNATLKIMAGHEHDSYINERDTLYADLVDFFE